MIRTVDEVIRGLPERPRQDELPAPEYRMMGPYGMRVGLAVGSMKRHMTDEGHQLFAGLPPGTDPNGFAVHWTGIDVKALLDKYPTPMLTTLLLQDKREYEGLTADRRQDATDRYTNVQALVLRPDIFKLTVLKDAHGNPAFHRQSAEEIGCHAWVTYYHPRIVKRLAPYVRPQHLIRTYHSLDRDLVPPFDTFKRAGCILSGAVSSAYPLRQRLVQAVMSDAMMAQTTWLKHPGYHRNGCVTPEYLQILSRFKVAICTSSRFGYAVRKIMEATACGCAVVTDLPTDEVLPGIDGNLMRVEPDAPIGQIAGIVNALIGGYDPYQQQKYADIAKHQYDYRWLGRKLAEDIEALRRTYNGSSAS